MARPEIVRDGTVIYIVLSLDDSSVRLDPICLPKIIAQSCEECISHSETVGDSKHQGCRIVEVGVARPSVKPEVVKRWHQCNAVDDHGHGDKGASRVW